MLLLSAALLLCSTGAAEEEINSSIIQFTLLDVDTGEPVTDATLTVDLGILTQDSTTTDENGQFTIYPHGLTNFQITATKDGYIPLNLNAPNVGAGFHSYTYYMGKVMEDTEFRFILLWGETPADLDLCLTGTADGMDEPFTVDCQNSQLKIGEEVIASLDVDDVSGYGPEVIRVSSLPEGFSSLLIVKNHGADEERESDSLCESGATVFVQNGAEQVSLTVERGHLATAWTVLELTSEALTPMNLYSFSAGDTGSIINVVDAESGAPLADAVISIASLSEPETPCADPLATDEQGEARVDLEGGEYQLTISKDGYITNVIQLVVQPGDYDNVVFALSRELGEDDFRIVLTWDSEPSDLDAHLLGYLPDTDESFHVFWKAKSAGSLVNLDVDDTSSFGPETITITGLPDRPLLYCVHDYTNRESRNSTALSNSGASVYVMRHNQMLATFNVSSGRTGTEWVLFWLMPDGSIRTVDEYAATSSIATVGSAAFERGVQ